MKTNETDSDSEDARAMSPRSQAEMPEMTLAEGIRLRIDFGKV